MNNYYLMTLQAEYLNNRQSKSLYNELFCAITSMAEIQIKFLCKNRMHLDKQYITDLAIQVASEIMSRFINNPKYCFKSYPTKAIRLEAFKQLYDARYRDRIKTIELSEEMEYTSSSFDKDLETSLSYREELQGNTQFFVDIDSDAKTIKKFPFFVKRVSKIHSLDWLKINIYNLRLLWEEYHGLWEGR